MRGFRIGVLSYGWWDVKVHHWLVCVTFPVATAATSWPRMRRKVDMVTEEAAEGNEG